MDYLKKLNESNISFTTNMILKMLVNINEYGKTGNSLKEIVTTDSETIRPFNQENEQEFRYTFIPDLMLKNDPQYAIQLVGDSPNMGDAIGDNLSITTIENGNDYFVFDSSVLFPNKREEFKRDGDVDYRIIVNAPASSYLKVLADLLDELSNSKTPFEIKSRIVNDSNNIGYADAIVLQTTEKDFNKTCEIVKQVCEKHKDEIIKPNNLLAYNFDDLFSACALVDKSPDDYYSSMEAIFASIESSIDDYCTEFYETQGKDYGLTPFEPNWNKRRWYLDILIKAGRTNAIVDKIMSDIEELHYDLDNLYGNSKTNTNDIEDNMDKTYQYNDLLGTSDNSNEPTTDTQSMSFSDLLNDSLNDFVYTQPEEDKNQNSNLSEFIDIASIASNPFKEAEENTDNMGLADLLGDQIDKENETKSFDDIAPIQPVEDNNQGNNLSDLFDIANKSSNPYEEVEQKMDTSSLADLLGDPVDQQEEEVKSFDDVTPNVLENDLFFNLLNGSDADSKEQEEVIEDKEDNQDEVIELDIDENKPVVDTELSPIEVVDEDKKSFDDVDNNKSDTNEEVENLQIDEIKPVEEKKELTDTYYMTGLVDKINELRNNLASQENEEVEEVQEQVEAVKTEVEETKGKTPIMPGEAVDPSEFLKDDDDKTFKGGDNYGVEKGNTAEIELTPLESYNLSNSLNKNTEIDLGEYKDLISLEDATTPVYYNQSGDQKMLIDYLRDQDVIKQIGLNSIVIDNENEEYISIAEDQAKTNKAGKHCYIPKVVELFKQNTPEKVFTMTDVLNDYIHEIKEKPKTTEVKEEKEVKEKKKGFFARLFGKGK